MGEINDPNWLPRLSDGSSSGPKPLSQSQRYKELYQDFADSWRVDMSTSLFDYSPGTSTDDFTIRNWPPTGPSCEIPNQIPPAMPIDVSDAKDVCRVIQDADRREDCIADVAATGEKGFVEAYLLSEKLDQGATKISVTVGLDKVTAFVRPLRPRAEYYLAGTVQFYINEKPYGRPVKVDKMGKAQVGLEMPRNRIVSASAQYIPGEQTVFLKSESMTIWTKKRD